MTTNYFSFAVEPFTYRGAEDEEEEAGRRRQPARRPAKAPCGRTQRPSGQRSSARPKRVRRPQHQSPVVVHEPAHMTSPAAGSEQIRWVQNTLNQVMNLSLPVDGLMGTTTRSAVRSFQEKQGLPVDGIVGPETEQALLAMSSGAAAAPSDDAPAQSDDQPAAEIAYGGATGWTPEQLTPVPGIEKTSQAFRLKVIRTAQSLDTDPNFLMAIMSFESNGFNPQARNPYSGATGLIQFMPKTAENLGTTTDALFRMTGEQQLDYVAKYFAPYTGRLKTLEDAYMAVLWPKAIGQGSNYVLFSSPSTAYQQNQTLDVNKDGKITVAEATSFVRKKLGSTAPAPVNPPTSPSGGQVNRSSPEYIRWVQQALNKIMGMQLAVDGISGPMTRSAIRSFQEKYGLLMDGIVGPQTEGVLIAAGAGNPPGSGASPYIPPSTPVQSPASIASRARLAQKILNNSRITLSTSSSTPNGNPRQNIIDTANGRPATSGCYDFSKCGATVNLSPKMLQALLSLANSGNSFYVTSFAGGKHSSGSDHYAGRAIDIGIWNGTSLGSPNSAHTAARNALIAAGSSSSQTFNADHDPDGSHKNHVHAAFY